MLIPFLQSEFKKRKQKAIFQDARNCAKMPFTRCVLLHLRCIKFDFGHRNKSGSRLRFGKTNGRPLVRSLVMHFIAMSFSDGQVSF